MSLKRAGAVALPVALLLALLPASHALAADPTKQECIDASEAGQDLQRAGKLIDARVKLATCVAGSCPGPVRQDCAQRLEELTHTLPTLILEAKDGAGNDLAAVRVVMDGKPFVDRLDGNAVLVDPGEHHFSFQSDGFETLEKSVVIRLAEKDRVVRVVLDPRRAAPSSTGQAAVPGSASPPAPAPAPTPAPSPAPESHGVPASAWVSFGVGIAGLIAGGVLTGLWASAKSDGDAACGTPGSCSPSRANDWESKQRNDSIGLGIGFGVAVVGAGLGIAFTLAHGGKETPPASARAGLDLSRGLFEVRF
jgi:hypothetical protein